jgi:OOP family OmpA-OmpF porin
MRTWRPSSDPDAGLVLEPVKTPGPWHFNAGAWAHYEQSPIVLRDATTGAVVLRPVEHSLGVDLVAGTGLGDRASVGVDLPLLLWQDGNSALPSSVVSRGEVTATGLGDVAIYAKATIASNDRQGVRAGFGMAALGALTFPTGDRESFMGDGAITSSLIVLGEYALGVGAVGATLGYRLRTDRRPWPDPGSSGVTFGDEVPWSLGISLRPKAIAPTLDARDQQTWEVALHGALPAGPVAPFGLGASVLSPVLLAVDDRIVLGRRGDVYVVWGGDFGLNSAAGVPTFRAVFSVGWAPRTHDRDADGVPDDVDECPDLPEDKDGIQDTDGCPEDDADGDGVLDEQDACPLVPGLASNDPRTNGCPPGSRGEKHEPAPGGR